MCVQGRGIFDGPVDDASMQAIAGWNANTVQISSNKESRLGLDNNSRYATDFWSSVTSVLRPRNLILAGGPAYSDDPGQWLQHRLQDPAGHLAAA